MWLWMASACVPRVPPAPAAAESAVAGAPSPVGGPWTSVVRAEEPLVGRIWSVGQRRWATEQELLADLRTVDVVLLGEKHDNPDHHRLQARLVEALEPSSCVFEMLDDGDPVETADTSAELAAASQWDTSGWPAFVLYEPVFDACYAGGALVAPGLPIRRFVLTLMRGGPLPAEVTETLPPLALPPDGREILAETLVRTHCGHLSIDRTGPMIDAQMLKDAWMTRAVERAPAQAVLIAGSGHVDARFGVPNYLTRPHRSVAFVEVEAGDLTPENYETGADWLWFTPAVDNLDPCAAFGPSPVPSPG